LGGGILAIFTAFQLSNVIDGVFLHQKSLEDVSNLLEIWFILVFFRALLIFVGEISSGLLAASIKRLLVGYLFTKKKTPPNQIQSGSLPVTVIQAVEALDAYYCQYLPQLIFSVVIPIAILIAIFPRDVISGIILLVTAPLIPIFMVLIGKASGMLTRRQWTALSRLSNFFLDTLQGLKTLKLLNQSLAQAGRIQTVSEQYRRATQQILKVTFLSALVLELVGTLSTAIIAVEIGIRLLHGNMDFQSAFFILLLAPEFYLQLRLLGQRFHAGTSGRTAAEKIFSLLDEYDLPEGDITLISFQENGGKSIDLTKPFVFEAKDVYYTYPNRSNETLSGITFSIHGNQHIALVGVSGSGKSTLTNLILRFITPTSGVLNVNGLNIQSLNLDNWRRQITWVSQKPYLFNDTIANNIRIGKADATEGDLIHAAQKVNLDQFIRSLPQGYQTPVGEQGARLSSGQAQRLALARAFLKNAPVVILDEPAAHLDPEEELLLESTLRILCQNCTVITIAHRLPTIFQADLILVLGQGKIIEMGKHMELINQRRYYYNLITCEKDKQ
jgi:ATP-binding cassette subfamily C protein CydD